MQTNVQTLDPAKIIVSEDRLPLDPARVTDLAKSMRRIGLLNPITVWRPSGVMPQLVAGRHRLEAAKRLKWDEIACVVLEGDRLDEGAAIRAGIAEIDENLIRRDLTPAQRAKLIAARKKAYEAVHPEAKQGGRPGKAGGGKAKMANLASFVSDTSGKTGTPERTIRRDATRAKALGPDLDRIAGTSLDKGAELDALAKLPATDRTTIIDRAAAGQNVSAILRAEASALDRGAKAVRKQRSLICDDPEKPAPPVNQQINALTRKIDNFVDDYCALAAAWAEATPQLEGEGRASLILFLHLAADKLLRLAQKLDGR